MRAGTHSFAATQTYDDGATVKWNAGLSVLPATGAAAPKQHPWGAVAAAVAGVARDRRERLLLAAPADSRRTGVAHFKRDSGTGCYGRAVIFHQFLNDDLGCASYLVG